MNKFVPTIAALAGALVLQVAVAPHLAIGSVVPNVFLLVVITLAFIEGRSAGAAAGFAAGLLFDLLGTGPVGAAALVFAVTGYIAGSLSEHMFAEGWLMPLTVVFAASLSAEIAYAGVLGVLGVGSPFWGTVAGVVLPAAVYNGALALLLYPWLARFLRRGRPMTTFGRIG